MDRKRLRGVRDKCEAALNLARQNMLHIDHGEFQTMAFETISELARAVEAEPEAVQSDADPHQLSLGEFIDLLEAWPNDKDKDACYFDFGGLSPTAPGSYRGDYSELALGFAESESYPEPTVATVLKWCLEAVGKEFEGYKGGEFTMSRSTPLWVANYGKTGGTAVVGRVSRVDHAFVIKTAYLD